MLAKKWLNNTRDIMTRIEETQMDNIRKAAIVMADTIEKIIGSTPLGVVMLQYLLRKCIHVLVVL